MTMVIVMMVIVTIVLWMTDGNNIHCEDNDDDSPGDDGDDVDDRKEYMRISGAPFVLPDFSPCPEASGDDDFIDKHDDNSHDKDKDDKEYENLR